MSVIILASRSENDRARAEMRRRGIDCTSSLPVRLLRKAGMLKGVAVGDRGKSWDVLKTVEFIEGHVMPGEPVLDIGAYASEMLCALHRLGYANLTGADLNPNIARMPHGDAIRYVESNFMETPFGDASFKAITAISVIEHGFDGRKLLAEISRLLMPGGYFIASVDYWPEKQDTSSIRAFGMDWKIFSESELRDFLADANEFGLAPHGEIVFKAGHPAARWMGRDFTFAWLAVSKPAIPRTID